jgi:hypothetical protein
MITASYKQNRHEDDLNQPLSVQPWGSDGDRRRYYLIEGLDDTHFRVYRESSGVIKKTWWSVAGSIEELTQLVCYADQSLLRLQNIPTPILRRLSSLLT